jgi:transcription-repair coupling factor (superfamily II helicase)
MPAYRGLVEKLGKREGDTVVALGAARPYLVAALYESLRVPVILVTAQPENAKKLHEQLSSWCGAGQIILFPEPDVLPYERLTPDTSTGTERVQVLSALAG